MPRGTLVLRISQSAAASDSTAPRIELRSILSAAAGGPQFVHDQPVAVCVRRKASRGGRGRRSVCRAPLAQSGAGATHVFGGPGNELALRARTKHSATRRRPSGRRNTSLVDSAYGVAPRDARRAELLHVSLK